MPGRFPHDNGVSRRFDSSARRPVSASAALNSGATVERFKEELVDGAQLEATKSNMKYGFLMDLETAQNVSFALIQTVVNTGGIEAINDYYHTLDSITAEDIREAARTYLVEAGRTTVTLVQARPGE